MAAVPQEFLSTILGNVASSLNFEEWKYSEVQFDSVGQNYFGILIPLKLTGSINGAEASIPLVIKLAPTDERYRVSGALSHMFRVEVFIYSTLLRDYQILQKNFKLTPQFTPICYYTCQDYCREAVVLQDMTAEGYKPYTRSMFLDFSHMCVSMKSLAIFHAYSFILRSKKSAQYDEAMKVCQPLTLQSNKRFMEVLGDRLTKAIRHFENTRYSSLFENLKRNQVRLVEAAWDSVKDTCICHGDMWKENILFKYVEGEVVSACLIDFQTARVSSPAYDVLYLIATSAAPDVRRTNLTNLLDIYYQHFVNTLKEAGLDARVYSKEMLESDLREVALSCVIVANTALWLASGCQQEGHVRSKQIFDTEEERVAAIHAYKEIMMDLVDDFLSNNLIRDN